MIDQTRRFGAGICTLILLAFFSTLAVAGEPSKAKVNGTLAEIDGVSVLRVWGTPEEQGYAHGYLLSEKLAWLADKYLATGPLGGSLERYNKQILPKVSRMKIDPQHEAELRAILAGVEARSGGPVMIPFLGQALRYEDLAAINCTGDLIRSGCSSFAAWGKMTEDSHTLAGRNMDWPILQPMLETPIILVQVPPAGSGKLGWVSATWPGYVGCITGMNAEGVTVATHDASGHTPSATSGFTPYGFTFREALEAARAQTAFEDIAQVIRERISIVGNNMMVTRPYTGDGPGAVVFEFDGDLSDGGGVTIRGPEGDNPFHICTNHFRKRSSPISCGRYAQLNGVLEKIAASEGKRHVTPKRAWKMLTGVSMDGIITHHSVVFEPNKHLMHVAFAENGRHAPRCKSVTLDVTKLLAGDYPGGK